MKSMRQSPVTAAVAAALMGLAGVVSTVDAAEISTTGTGQALIFPYYTVNGGWITTVNVMNTSDKTLAVKVRLHEKKNSRDVLDFVIVMSPNDVWTGWLQKSAQRSPQLFTDDNSCTSPLVVNGAKGSDIAYSGQFDDTGGTGPSACATAMSRCWSWASPSGPRHHGRAGRRHANIVPYNAKHVDGVPRDCVSVDKEFIASGQVGAWHVDPTSTRKSGGRQRRSDRRGRLQAPTGHRQPAQGQRLLAAGRHRRRRRQHRHRRVRDWSDQNYVTAQNFPWFLEPTFASSDGLWTVTGVEPSSRTPSPIPPRSTSGRTTAQPAPRPTGSSPSRPRPIMSTAFNEQIQAAVSKYRNGLADRDLRLEDPPADVTLLHLLDDYCPDHGRALRVPLRRRGHGRLHGHGAIRSYDRSEGTIVLRRMTPALPGTAPVRSTPCATRRT